MHFRLAGRELHILAQYVDRCDRLIVEKGFETIGAQDTKVLDILDAQQALGIQLGNACRPGDHDGLQPFTDAAEYLVDGALVLQQLVLFLLAGVEVNDDRKTAGDDRADDAGQLGSNGVEGEQFGNTAAHWQEVFKDSGWRQAIVGAGPRAYPDPRAVTPARITWNDTSFISPVILKVPKPHYRCSLQAFVARFQPQFRHQISRQPPREKRGQLLKT